MFDTAVRAEIALGRGDAESGLLLWRTAAAALRDTQRPGPLGDLSGLEPWALEVQAVAVVAHAQLGRLGPVAEITGALPAALSALAAGPGPPPGTFAASYGLVVCGSLLLALGMTDIDRGQRAADADGPAYAEAVSAYAGLDPEALRAAARAALQARAQVIG